MRGMGHREKQRGAVSLLVVVFAAMLMVVITISFVKLMIQDQSEASQTDLSQSAYDAAQAGVEDAKRLLLANQKDPSAYPISSTPTCDMVANGLGLTTTATGVSVQTNNEKAAGGNNYDESYTCDEITMDTPDVTATPLGANKSFLVPINTTSPTNTLNIDWFTQADAGATKPTYLTNTRFPTAASWTAASQAPVLRVQLIQIDPGGFTLNDLDANEASATQTGTVFLVPQNGSTANPANATQNILALDSRRGSLTAQPASSTPRPVLCLGTTHTFAESSTGYACNVTIQWKTASTTGVYLRITPLYSGTSVSLNFGSGSNTFDNVQPQIDSTGRANTEYRRVSTRIMYGNTNFPFPVAAVNTTNAFCKTYVMAPGYTSSGVSCTP